MQCHVSTGARQKQNSINQSASSKARAISGCMFSMMKKTIKSPCQLICTYDEDKVCVGCYRSAEEVATWDRLTNAEKQEVIEKTNKRREAKGGSYYGFG